MVLSLRQNNLKQMIIVLNWSVTEIKVVRKRRKLSLLGLAMSKDYYAGGYHYYGFPGCPMM